MNGRPIIILGVNGNCIDIAEAVEARDGMHVLGFLDDDPNLNPGMTVAGYPLLGRIDQAGAFPEAHFVCGIGSPKSFRAKPGIIHRTGVPAERWATVVHPTCSVSRHAAIGPGSVLLSQVAVGARASIGAFCTVLQGCIISHDSVVGDFATLAGGVCLSGGCRIGSNAYVGCRAALREGMEVGARALVGMGSIVVKDVPPDAVVFGNPARSQS